MVTTLCPSCGYDLKLASPDEIVEECPCCAFDFREFHRDRFPYSHFDPKNIFASIWRGGWAQARMPWRGNTIPHPANWDPVKQMYGIDVMLAGSFEEWKHNHPVISPENKGRFLEIALEKIAHLNWKPAVIEALWDGDTQGWFLNLSVSMKGQHDQIKRFYIFSLRVGGDIRLFNGQVPPWPEAQVGSFVGNELSKQLVIPFYFPSPDEADDDYADWWHRDEQRRCASCGKYLISNSARPDLCYRCQLRQERAKR